MYEEFSALARQYVLLSALEGPERVRDALASSDFVSCKLVLSRNQVSAGACLAAAGMLKSEADDQRVYAVAGKRDGRSAGAVAGNCDGRPSEGAVGCRRSLQLGPRGS